MQSELSILNLPYEPIKGDEEIFSLLTKEEAEKFSAITVERHTVIEKPEYKQFFSSHGLNLSEDCNHKFFGGIEFNNNRYIYSSSWHGAGEGYSYTGETYPISAEQPVEFEEFYNLLESINPNMSFLLFKKIERECVSIEETYCRDYYTSAMEYRYKLDLSLMYDLIKEWEENRKEE